MYTDLKALVGLESWPSFKLCDPKSFYAGPRIQARGSKNWPQHAKVLKVKAHQDVEALAPGSQEWLLAKGNQWVDSAAKSGALSHAQLHHVDLIEVGAEEACLKAYLAYVARCLPLWKPEGRSARATYSKSGEASSHCKSGLQAGFEVFGKWGGQDIEKRLEASQPTSTLPAPQPEASASSQAPPPPPPPPPQCATRRRLRGKVRVGFRIPEQAPEGHHKWSWLGSRWCCTVCLRHCVQDPPIEMCPGACAKLGELLNPALNHELWFASYENVHGEH